MEQIRGTKPTKTKGKYFSIHSWGDKEILAKKEEIKQQVGGVKLTHAWGML